MHRYTSPWESWEMHPSGEELVVCTEGTIKLLQEIDGEIGRWSSTKARR